MTAYGLGYLVICAIMGALTGVVARRKGYPFWVWFLVGGVLPGLALTGVLLARSEHEELRRQCPGCGRVVMLHDALCTRCGTELDFPEEAIASHAAAARARRLDARAG